MKRQGLARSVLLGTLALVVAVCVVTLCGGCSTGEKDEPAPATGDASAEVDPDDPYATGTHHAVIEVEGYGTIEVTLNANVAPITVSNFCHLAESGFYDGLTFHRVVPGFMIQGGDPAGDGTGGSDESIKGEFADNGVDNNIPHVRGTISMARASDYDSASSQFFIMQETNSSLDGQYATFGTVTSGMEVVDAICEQVPVADEQSGYVAEEDQPVITSVTIVD
ncbi:MAG TPA: peptidylprolyl isomerase [Candidatus Olsenella pullicola]|nr:peptidylprolyl isomerase [Candidatus Olsenella pullicola]